MNWLDLAIVVVLLWFTITSLTAGLIREVFNLAGIVVGVMLAGRYYQEFAPALTFLPSPQWMQVVSFGLIVIAATVAAHILAALLQQVLSFLFLGWLDHLGGGLFGLAKGALMVLVVLLIMTKFPVLGAQELVRGSLLAPIFLAAAPLLLSLLPKEFGSLKDLVS